MLTITNSGVLKSSGSSYFATAKGIKAGAVNINGGSVKITMSGSAAKGIKADSGDGTGIITITGGTVNITTSGTGAYDGTEKDSKGSSGLKADKNMVISGGVLTLKSTGSGGKCIKVDGTLSISGGNISATTTGGTYSYSSSKAQPKAIKSDGNMTISGGDVTASSNSHEAIETKGTLTVTDGTVYAKGQRQQHPCPVHFLIHDALKLLHVVVTVHPIKDCSTQQKGQEHFRGIYESLADVHVVIADLSFNKQNYSYKTTKTKLYWINVKKSDASRHRS